MAGIDPATGKPLPAGVIYRGELQYRARKMVAGARITKTFDTPKLARQWLEETAAAARAGTHVDSRPTERMTVRNLVERFVDERLQDGGERRGAKEDRIGHVPSILRDEIAELRLPMLTPAAVRGFRDRQGALHSKATVVKRLNLLASIIAYARSEWDITLRENPASGAVVKRPRGADRKRNRRLQVPSAAAIRAAQAAGEPVPESEEARLLEAIRSTYSPADAYLVRWSIESAMRAGESIGLHWQDIDIERRQMRVLGRHGLGTKADDHREELGPEMRPIVVGALAVLQELLAMGEHKPEDLVFPVGSGGAFSIRFRRACARAGLLDLTFHDLRHEATSRLAKRYTNPLDLKRVTGHKDLKSTDRYYQPDLSELASVV